MSVAQNIEIKDLSLRRYASILQWLTVGHGFIEGVGAIIASRGSDSIALLGFGLDSLIELLSALVVLWRLASMQGRARWHVSERMGLRLVGIGFVVLAVSIGYDAIEALVLKETPRESVLGVVVAAASVALMPFLGYAKRKIGGQIGSAAMKADAKQTHFCAYLAGVTLVGLVLNARMGFWWADPVAALVTVPLMGWEGFQALKGKACGCCACSL